MSAQDTAAVMMEYGNLFVGTNSGNAVNVGALQNLKFMAVHNRVKINSDNRGTILNKDRLDGKVEAELLEPGNMTLLETLFKGLVTLTATAGTLVSGATVVKTSGQWAYNQPILLTGQNATLAAPTIASVVAGTNGALVANLDYVLVKDPDTSLWYVQVIDSTTVTTASQTITITYSYTPAVSQVLTGGTSQTATSLYVRIEGPSEDDSSVTRNVELAECIVTSDLLLEFLDVEQANKVSTLPVTFESNKATTWTVTDEINPS